MKVALNPVWHWLFVDVVWVEHSFEFLGCFRRQFTLETVLSFDVPVDEEEGEVDSAVLAVLADVLLRFLDVFHADKVLARFFVDIVNEH